jgi:hypothetical protein
LYAPGAGHAKRIVTIVSFQGSYGVFAVSSADGELRHREDAAFKA